MPWTVKHFLPVSATVCYGCTASCRRTGGEKEYIRNGGLSGGSVRVSAEQWEMYVKLSVSDTGKGISESNQAAIFRRFYREEEVHEQQGVGIGLYLTREIVTRQGGYIKVTSEPEQGSEFSIMFPTR